MTIRNLKHLFAPGSVAVIGASNRPHRVGTTVLKNLAGGFSGKIYPVNPKYEELAGLKTYAGVGDLPEVPELAVICTPAQTVPGLIEELGARGTKAAVVLSAGLSAVKDWQGHSMKDLMLTAAKPHLLRILGPNCVGLLVPRIGLNASFAHVDALPGKIAFLSQSGAMMTAVLDWARSRRIGFSKFVSLGDSADVDFGDLLDYLAGDPDTQAILMYVEAITSARKFMSAARAAARSKPVLVIKAGRVPEGAQAATSHTGALAGSDDVYDAAIRRAGMLRMFSTEDLFDAVETLAHARKVTGDRLAIMTNGGGPGVMATDTLIGAGGHLAQLSPATMQALDADLPAGWSHGNPVDIIGDAPAERYVQTLKALLQEREADAVLFIQAPTAIVPGIEIATALQPLLQDTQRNVLACWLGGETAIPPRAVFSQAGVPTYDTPEKAVRGFMQMVRYRRNQELLMEVPALVSDRLQEDRNAARTVVRAALDTGRTLLSESEAKAVLAAYGIPVVDTRVVTDAEQAAQAAEAIGFPVALKIVSHDITHKSDVGGVVLDLADAAAVRAAALHMLEHLQRTKPAARLEGFTVQSMVRRPEGRELIVGVATDPVFGPVILFGHGGIEVEVTKDHAIGLPPLNDVLARELVARTRVARLLRGFRHRPPADLDAISRTLIQISDMVIDLPEVVELDINPLLADADGVIALDARIKLAPAASSGVGRLAIRPYPAQLEETIQWQGEEPLVLRPIRPEDAPQHVAFFNKLDAEDVRARVFTRMRELQHSQLARLTQIDYDREMAFIATRKGPDGQPETIGVARGICDPDNVWAEFAIVVRSDMKGKGLGRLLLGKLIAYCRQRGTQEMVGSTLRENRALLGLAREFGFQVALSPDGDTWDLKLPLNPGTAS